MFDAIKRSGALLKNSWGERIGAGFFFGLVGFVSFLSVAGLDGIVFMLLLKMNIFPGFSPFLACLVVSGLSIMCLMSTAETVFTALMYQHATGKAVGTFSKEDLNNSFVRS